MNIDWGYKELGKLATIQYGFTAKSKNSKVGPKFLRITDIKDNSIDWASVPYCEIEEMDIGKFLLKNGDIVFARTGATTGKSILIKDPPISIFASYLIRVKINDHKLLDPKFLSLFFQSEKYWGLINKGISGSAQGGFNASKLSKIIIPLPPLSEQRRIVALLDQVFEGIDKAIINNNKSIQNVEELYFVSLKNELDRNDGLFQTSNLGALLEVLRNGINCKQNKKCIGEKISRIQTISYGVIDLQKVGYCKLTKDQKSTYKIMPGDILFSHINSVPHVGKTAIFHSDDDLYHGVNLLLFRPINEILPGYLQLYLQYLYKSGFWKNVCKQSVNQASVNQQDIKKVIIKYPKSLLDQDGIMNKLTEIREKISNIEKIYSEKSHLLSELKYSLLNKAFSGEL
jgi:type I restriction enzyme, S subunit